MNDQNISEELKKLREQLGEVVENQKKIQAGMRMIFFDVTNFENMVMKMMDNGATQTFQSDQTSQDDGYKH
ncbi:MAG: hypothetical protein HQM16_04185 [Deltaproteobacteria bacterium]|nr:hypothetical protein [Deltaproteobacteria bacterium]